MAAEPEPAVSRRRLEVRGLVQGVGFRPLVYRLAQELRLGGWVRNHSGGVTIEIEGAAGAVDAFIARLRAAARPPIRIDTVEVEEVAPRGEQEFSIEPSVSHGGAVALVLPDLATCDACLAEILDPRDRRYRYAFTNCTHCGPRFTIVRDVPYDRVRTTMAGFVMCPACAGEYEDPVDRRFHAQPNACPECGPRLTLVAADGTRIPGDPLTGAVGRLIRGEILAIKGLGGYHLACDARNPAAVAELRARKHRDAKPLAVMVADLAMARELGEVSAAEEALLASPAAPIVLLARRADSGLSDQLAPDCTTVGVMLAYTPLHHLLLRGVGRPLVMTSGNLSDEPIAHEDADARRRLAGLVDAFLVHDRPIQRRCDDSVVRIWRDQPLFLRRSRGYAPAPLELEDDAEEVVLAVGGHQKNTFCLTRGREAFVSHHVGDLENDLALDAFETGISDFERLFELRPAVIAHDLHPDYLSSRYALERAERENLEVVGVQHHHAHIAACLADRGHPGPVIGLSLDGTGWGPDGTVWGGEVLLADRAGYRRLGRLRPFALAGGGAAVRQGWRVALALARDAGEDFADEWPGVAPRLWAGVVEMLTRDVQCVLTSSAGRLFDGFSALLGVRAVSRYEGEGAVALEGACEPAEGALPFAVNKKDLDELDWRPAVSAALAERRRGVPPGETATRFHRGLAIGLATLCEKARQDTGVGTVAVSGGCFQNITLLSAVSEELERRGFDILTHRRVPPNDGGLSLGQAVVARARVRGCISCV